MAENPPEPSALAALTRRLAAGEDAAFEEFHGLFARRLFRYLLVLLRGDEVAAGDVLQDTLVRVARHVRRFDDEAVFWSWLTRLARSAAADHGRKGGRYRRFLARFSREPAAAPQAPEPGRLARALEQALARLPVAEASLLQAKYHGGESVRAIAARLALSEEAVGSRLARARHQLRRLAFEILHHDESSPAQ
jgi:RNA polymerase sigma-70 factor, ECF subfamily